MALPTGSRLGPYEIVSALGAGGMGEVYKARDTKLGRDVALKILADSVTHDPERIARFRREAQMLAALNHPHIGMIYGLDEADGRQFLVLELIDGETLADRLKRGALPLDEAVAIAGQMAEALEAAHRQGIVHRDLKPANIALTRAGNVKVLDFGLAKPIEAATGVAVDVASSPTLTSPAMMTGVGMILGTAAYMSPEQAKGKAADTRSDVWAFGCVLFEMLTGRQLFAGATLSDTLAAVLKDQPDLTQVPPRVQRLLRACLQKEPRQRLQAISDSRLLLEDPAEAAPETRSTGTRGPETRSAGTRSAETRKAGWALAAGTLALVAALASWAPWRRPAPSNARAPMRLDLDLGAAPAATNLGADAILSPDGTRLVFVGQGPDGTSRLLTRRLDQSQPVELAGSEGAYSPFFAPSGQWVAFFAGGRLKKTQIDGGKPVILCEAPAGRGGSWGEDGNIIAALDSQVGLSLVPSEGGKVVSLTTLGPGENTHRWPQVLPGGKIVLFTSNTTFANFDEASIGAVSLADHTRKIVLARAGMYPRYVPSGHVIYVTNGTLFAVAFDPATLEVRGRPSAVVEDVSNDTTYGFPRLDFSATGMLLYRRGRTEGVRTVHWMDSSGRMEALEIEAALYQFPRVSPDGSKVIWMINQGQSADLWIYDWQRGSKTRLTDGKSVYAYPAWSPNGQYVVFSSSGGMFWTRADGAGKPQPLTVSKALQRPTSFAPDSRRLVFSELNPAGGLIQTVLLDGASGQLRASSPEVFLQTSSALPFPAFSPDGRWLAYADAESGSYEVYVRAFPDRGTRWPISSGGGTMPVWSRNGRELFYRTEDSRIMVATYTVRGDTFVADKPRVWSEKRLANTGLVPNFDLAPDGKRFVVLMPPGGAGPTDGPGHVTLVMNFFDELRRIAPATR
jgi:Tol biopolymer transport system component/tRNA A-37 threonylcarbamoyl transferase component Bud32